MSEHPTPYRTERESDNLAVAMIVTFGIVGGLARFSTEHALVAVLAGVAGAYVTSLVADQFALRSGAELITQAEAAKRQAMERARRPIWSVCLQSALHVSSTLILLNLLTMRESDFAALPFVILASLLLGAIMGVGLALHARWQLRRMGHVE
jgi:hypothetical protein